MISDSRIHESAKSPDTLHVAIPLLENPESLILNP